MAGSAARTTRRRHELRAVVEELVAVLIGAHLAVARQFGLKDGAVDHVGGGLRLPHGEAGLEPHEDSQPAEAAILPRVPRGPH